MKIKINKQSILEILEESSKKNFENCPCEGIKEKLGFSCGKDDKGYFIYTHRARSKSYNSLSDITMKDIKFIDSTG